ncbi:MFS transporter [Actinocatenispora sera]|uniref:MFS transporter n=1 Tax=Actinocatenispora sera TaxID=390989 RepID=UPI0033E3E001
MSHGEGGSILRQPKSVWAVAFACVIAFMGIGLVDPILPAISKDLHANPSQVELLFTSYMLVTGVAMVITGWVSSRIGPKRTLLAGLVLIVVFSALAGSADGVNGIIGFRAGWGLGNALFIATALAVIVGAASGGVGGAIILYEAALGVGIAVGPLLGGLLGGISWRGPFIGVAVLMTIAFVAVITLLPTSPKPTRRSSLADPFKALRHRGLLTTALTALFYNYGFFTLLAWTPFPMGLSAHQLGLVFFGWGLCLAVTSVFVAPRLQVRFGTVKTLYVVQGLIALTLVVMGIGTQSKLTLILAVIIAGLFLGINNTLITQAVMKAAPVERPVASAAYSFVRFIGGAIAPFLAGKLGEQISPNLPFYVGAGCVVIGILVLASGRKVLARVDEPEEPAPTPADAGRLLVAVDAGPAGTAVVRHAAEVAAQRGLAVHLLHVRETEVVGDDAVALEGDVDAEQLLGERLAQLRAAGVTADGEIVASVGTHPEVARLILDRAVRLAAPVVVIGSSSHPGLHGLLGGSVVAEVSRHAGRPVLVIDPAADRLSPVTG